MLIRSIHLGFLSAEPNQNPYRFVQWRFIAKVRPKWVKNRGIDHIIDTETNLKAALKRSPTGFLTSKSVSDWQKLLGLTVPVLRF